MSKSKGKLFVGGLSWQTTNEEFEDFFRAFGEVIDSVVMRKEDGKSRGFGFVTFADPEHAQDVLSRGDIELGGRRVDCKPAVPREDLDVRAAGGRVRGPMGPRTSKIFVGGLSKETTRDEFERYFDKYGDITDAIVMTDRETGRSRGFGFITFATEESADRVVSQAVHIIGDKQVETKKAIPKTQMDGQRATYGSGMMGGGFNNPFAAAAGFRRPQQPFVRPYGSQGGYGMPNPAFGSYASNMTPQATGVYSSRDSVYGGNPASLYGPYGNPGGYMSHADTNVFGGNPEDVYGGGAVRSVPRDHRSSYHPYTRGSR